MWWRSVVNFSSVLCLATCRMRSNPCDTVARFCARPVLCWLALPSAPALGSTGSAADRSALFTGFTATTAGSDFSRSCIIGYGSSPFPCGPLGRRVPRPKVGPPRFPRLPFVRDVFFDHGRASVPRIAGPHMLPSTLLTGSASAVLWLSRLNGTPHTISVAASHPPSPATTQHSLPGARYGLHGPVSHRQDHASFPGAQAIHTFFAAAMDCFASPAMTGPTGATTPPPPPPCRPANGSAEWPPDDRLRRAIQYSEASVMESKGRGVLDTRLRGYDDSNVAVLVGNRGAGLLTRLGVLDVEFAHRAGNDEII